VSECMPEREREGGRVSGRERARLLKRAAVLSAPIDYGAGKVEAHRAKTLREKNYPMEPIRHPHEVSSARATCECHFWLNGCEMHVFHTNFVGAFLFISSLRFFSSDSLALDRDGMLERRYEL